MAGIDFEATWTLWMLNSSSSTKPRKWEEYIIILRCHLFSSFFFFFFFGWGVNKYPLSLSSITTYPSLLCEL